MKNQKRKIDSGIEIKWGAVMSYCVIAFNIIAGLIYTPWMVKKVGQSDYGIYTLASTLIAFFTMDFGISDAIARFLCKYNAEDDQKKKNDFLGVSIKIYAVIDGIIFIAFLFAFLFADRIYAQLSLNELHKFRVVFLISGFYSLMSFPFMPLNGILVAHERFIFYRFTELFNKVMTIIMTVVVLLLNGGLYGLILVNAGIGVATIILKVYYIKSCHIVQVNIKAKDKEMLRKILSFSLWSCMLVISQRLIFNVEPTILGAFSGTAQIAVFSVASTIEGYTATLAGALDALFLPKVTRLYEEKGDSESLQTLMIKVGRIQFMLVGLLLMGLIMMGKEFMVLWMGEAYKNSYYVLIFMVAPSMLILPESIADTALIATDRIHWKAICALTTAVINVVVSILLVPGMGAIGAGVGIFAGNVIGSLVIKNIVYVRCLNIKMGRFICECFLKLCIPLVIIAAIMWLVQRFFPVGNLVMFMVKAAVVGLVYMPVMWFGFMNVYEKNIIKSLARSVAAKK